MITALLFASSQRVGGELRSYVAKHESPLEWRRESRHGDLESLRFTSGEWQGQPWMHTLVIVHPSTEDRRHVAILVITGDRVDRRPDPDLVQARTLAEKSHFPVAVLFDVPNQPVNRRREDDLIAWSFGEYLRTGDVKTAALFPMTRAVVRAMDVLVAATKSRRNALRKFVVTGESKRGWTTWLAGALDDRRIIGIVPVSFDFLDFPAQIKRQIELWGKPSEMLASYTRAGLDQVLKSDAGKRLLRLVDPYSYLPANKAPTLIIRGSNDPFWATDATRLYFDALRQPHSLLVLPNKGHDFGTHTMYSSTVAAFARSCSGVFRWPLFEGPSHAQEVWRADSEHGDFRRASWREIGAQDKNDPPLSFTGIFWTKRWNLLKGGVRSTFEQSSTIHILSRK